MPTFQFFVTLFKPFHQGGQIFLGTNLPKRKKFTISPLNKLKLLGPKLYQMAVNFPNGHKI
jgi:hypothetical protein